VSTTPALAPPRRSTFVDKDVQAVNGYLMMAIGLILIAACAWLAYPGIDKNGYAFPGSWFAMTATVIAIAVVKGLVILQPNESVVCLLFGNYVGTEHRPGLWWVNPFNAKTKVSRRLETLEAGPLKVNDAAGNPVDIGAVVVWRVEDAARALLEVGSYANYVKAQSETALRRMASVHPYDQVEAEDTVERDDRPLPMSTISLRDGGDAIIETLLKEIRTRMEPIGVQVVEARISHLAYSSEIASAMLRKQAASAVVAARRMVVKGAVSIVETPSRNSTRRILPTPSIRSARPQ